MRRFILLLALISATLVVPVAAAGAQGASCVGQFASTSAPQSAGAFGADIRFGAQFASQPNFGAGVVAPYAHEARDAC